MAWTQADLNTIEASIASPEVSVRYADGREVVYASVSEKLKARDAIKASLAASTGNASPRCTLAEFSKG